MIMPGDPQIGDVYRPENIPGLVFEEVTVKTVDMRVAGPYGPVEGAMIAREVHQNGTREDKTFAPGYGEFFTGSGGDVEAMALAVPADALDGPPPAELEALSAGADRSFDAVRSKDWKAASASVEALNAAWKTYRAGQVSPRLAKEMSRALEALSGAVTARDQTRAGAATIDLAQSTLDLELRHQAPAEIDPRPFSLGTSAPRRRGGGRRGRCQKRSRHARVDPGSIRARALGKVELTRLDHQLVVLRSTVGDEDLRGAAVGAARLRATLARV